MAPTDLKTVRTYIKNWPPKLEHNKLVCLVIIRNGTVHFCKTSQYIPLDNSRPPMCLNCPSPAEFFSSKHPSKIFSDRKHLTDKITVCCRDKDDFL